MPAMPRWKKSLRAPFVVGASILGSLSLFGCPSHLCPACEIKAATFTVDAIDVPAGAKIQSVVVHAVGHFTGHCPNPQGNQDCTVSGYFTSSSVATGPHQVTLDDWPFDSKGDTVDATVEVTFKSLTSKPAPPPHTIPGDEITFVTVETGDYHKSQ